MTRPSDPTATLPPGVRLVRTLRGHRGWIGRLAWSPDGRLLATPGTDGRIRLWDVETGETAHSLRGHDGTAYCAAFHPSSRLLATGGHDGAIALWNVDTGALLAAIEETRAVDVSTDRHPLLPAQWSREGHFSVAFDPAGRLLAWAGEEYTIQLWDVTAEWMLAPLVGRYGGVNGIQFDPTGEVIAWIDREGVQRRRMRGGPPLTTLRGPGRARSIAFARGRALLAGALDDGTVVVWDTHDNDWAHYGEWHTDFATAVDFSADDRLLASRSGGDDGSVIVWRVDSLSPVAIIPGVAGPNWAPGLAFHPTRPLLAVVGSDADTPEEERDRVVHVYELDTALLLGGAPPSAGVTYATAKVVLVGDSGVGKTGLGWRLAKGEFKEHASTHGQQFWLLDQISADLPDGSRGEAVLWDLAGQPDYRLIHALFLDDADVALVLFAPTRDDDPLQGVEFWLRQLGVAAPNGRARALLVAARADRGAARLTQAELDAFCARRGLAGYVLTSALRGDGIGDLVARLRTLVAWHDKPSTVTTETFKRIKDLVLGLKESDTRGRAILTEAELRAALEAADPARTFSDAELRTAVRHLANHGYVTTLKTSRGAPRVLLAPELLNNLAASFVLEARRNPKGLGALEERRLLAGGYPFPEIERLAADQRDVLLDSATALFLEHNVCFRETDPLNGEAYLVFPELINLKRPLLDDGAPTEDGVAYTVVGAVENVYASIVVLLGYTHTFTRTNQWRHQARYEVGHGLVCGFRVEAERAGELDFVLYYGADVPPTIRTLFQSLFESFLARRQLALRRFDPVRCANGHPLHRAVVRERLAAGVDFAFCNSCGDRIALRRAEEPTPLTTGQAAEVRAADQRSRFEQVLFRLKAYATEQRLAVPTCFVSYAWGDAEHERWVEQLAKDLLNAGLAVVLDRWENARIGASVPRFVERVRKTDCVVVVGTPSYREKYENKVPMGRYVVAAEGDLIGVRMIGSEADKESVLPVLLAGSDRTAFPDLLQGRVYADFRDVEAYFDTALRLLLSLYDIPSQHSVAVELRESLRSSGI